MIDMLFGIFAIVLATWLLWKLLKRRTEIPGPRRNLLPVVGYLPFLDRKKPNVQFCKLAKKHGNVFQLRLGKQKVVVVNKQKAIRKLYSKSGGILGTPNWLTSRIKAETMDNFIFAQFSPGYWVHKRMLFKAIEEYTTERSKNVTDAVCKIVNRFVDEASKKSQPFEPISLCERCAIILVYYHSYGQLLDSLTHRKVEEVLKLVASGKSTESAIVKCDFLPWMKRLPTMWKPIAKAVKAFEDYRDWHFKEAAPIVDAYTPDKPRTCLIDYLCHAASQMDDDDRSVLGVDRTVLIKTSCNVSMFGARLSLTVPMIWIVMLMAHYPEIQQKVREEIIQKLGSKSCLPTPQDVEILSYTTATFKEMFRYASPAPLGTVKRLNIDTELDGYIIPHDTVVMLNLYSANRDESIFFNPDTFDPERFLTADGNLDKEAMKLVIDSGLGPRRCGGIALMQFELYLYFVQLVRSCEIHESPDFPIDTTNYYLDVGAYPKPFKVIMNKL